MTATTIEEMQSSADHADLIRKVLRAVAFLAPRTVDLPETITGTDSQLISLPEDWLPFGIVTDDGWTFGSDVTTEDIPALGYAQAPRSDITGIAKTIQVTPLETGRRHMLELTKGMDLSTTTQAASGEIVFDEPEFPEYAEWRLLIIGADGTGQGQWFLGRGYPRVKVTGLDNEQWQKTGAVSQQVTLTVYPDDEVGTPVRNYIAGLGAKAAAAALGFTAAA